MRNCPKAVDCTRFGDAGLHIVQTGFFIFVPLLCERIFLN